MKIHGKDVSSVGNVREKPTRCLIINTYKNLFLRQVALLGLKFTF